MVCDVEKLTVIWTLFCIVQVLVCGNVVCTNIDALCIDLNKQKYVSMYVYM